MKQIGQILAIAGILLLLSPGWLPLEISTGVVRAGAAALLVCGLTVAVLFSVLANLPVAARMDPIADEEIPGPCEPLLARCEALGFARLGPALRVHLQPKASIVPLWSAADRSYATVFHSDGAPGQAHYDFVTLFEPLDVALTSAATPSAGVLPPAHGSFVQILPGAAPEDLLEHHRKGCGDLAREARVVPRACHPRFEDLLGRALRRQRRAFLRSPLRHTWVALFRVLTKRTPALGPVAAQPGWRSALEAIHDPLAHREAEEEMLAPLG